MQIITHRKHAVNLTQTERVISAAGGSLLVVAGLSKKSAAGVALAVGGALLLRRAFTGHSYVLEAVGVRTAPLGQGSDTTSVPYELGIRVDCKITINKPRQEIYRLWRDFRSLPRWLPHVKSVREIGSQRTHWMVQAPVGRIVEWDAVVHNEIENELIAWRTLPGADVDHAGAVIFRDAPGGGAEVQVELQYNPPGGMVTAFLSRWWGQEPTQQIEADLQRLKHMVESGAAAGAARETSQPPPRDADVQEALEETFPASDAPAYGR